MQSYATFYERSGPINRDALHDFKVLFLMKTPFLCKTAGICSLGLGLRKVKADLDSEGVGSIFTVFYNVRVKSLY